MSTRSMFLKTNMCTEYKRAHSPLTHKLQCQEYSQFNRIYRKQKNVLFLWPEIERLITFF